MISSSTKPAESSKLKVIAGGSISALLDELSPQFETATLHRLSIHFDSTPNIIARMTSGTPFDAIVVPNDVVRDAGVKTLLATSPVDDIALVDHGVIVRAGAPKPDISTPEALNKALLDAKSVAYLSASAAGSYITKMFEHLGIAENIKAKTRVQARPTQIAPAVARGETELVVSLTNMLIAPSVGMTSRTSHTD